MAEHMTEVKKLVELVNSNGSVILFSMLIRLGGRIWLVHFQVDFVVRKVGTNLCMLFPQRFVCQMNYKLATQQFMAQAVICNHGYDRQLRTHPEVKTGPGRWGDDPRLLPTADQKWRLWYTFHSSVF